MRKPTPSDYVGKGRQHADSTRRLYLQANPRAPGTVLATHVTFEALGGEKTLRDVVQNHRRRVGEVHDPAELAHGDMAASDCPRAAIQLTVGAPDAIAATHLIRSRAHVAPNETTRVGTFDITLTRKAYDEFGPEAGLRLFDYRDHPTIRGLRQLQGSGKDPKSPVWDELDSAREREHMVAMLIPSPRNEPTATVIAWAHWLAALEADGLISAKRQDRRLKARDLPLPADFFEPVNVIAELRRFNARFGDYTAVLEESATAVKRFLKVFLMLFGFTSGALLGASHTDVLKEHAHQIIEKLIGH
jgi:hypothetical protein